MTIVKNEIIPVIQKGRQINKLVRLFIIRCDNCGVEKSITYRKKSFESQFHYCSRKCFYGSNSLKKSGPETRKKVMMEKYGVENISQLQETKNKKANTLFINYGTYSPLQSKEILKKVQITNIGRYGGITPMSDPNVVNKLKSTMLEIYGVENTSQLQKTKDKKKKTCLKHYGVENHMLSEEVKSKIDFKKIWQKAHETKKRNGTYKTSKIEDMLYEQFSFIYGKENIERQIIVNGWSIDFYIRPINIYVQLDGVYWHGLDRDINMIRSSTSEKDKNIARKYDIDLEQIRWFKENNLILIRITDEKCKDIFKNE